MGLCNSKPSPSPSVSGRKDDLVAQHNDQAAAAAISVNGETPKNRREEVEAGKKSPFFPFYSPSPAHYLFSKKSPARSPANLSSNSTPKRFFKRPFPPPSPAKHIRAALARRHGSVKPNEAAIPEGNEAAEGVAGLDKALGFRSISGTSMRLGKRLGEAILGTPVQLGLKRVSLRVKMLPSRLYQRPRFGIFRMTTAIAIEDVRREVKILRALTGHNNLVQFYDAYEDHDNVYIVMELCEGGELLDRILSRGGKYTEEDAKAVMIQILNVVSFCHLQGVVHRDLKPEVEYIFHLCIVHHVLNERLNDIVGSAYYVAPEVLHRSYTTEADVWSIGVIAYILLCGSRPFWARTESGIFRAVLKADPSFDEPPWPSYLLRQETLSGVY
ncbi:CDPK-related kinase 5 [Vitis vinifera]|uniref:CDPK-related kinase 5 n=1 Tax=Vitis vinifera TaxID=29760 RepID=A0A438FB35_VITVI|nr:CDPK-related kinase 5 [Vitis vinifera]